MKTSNNGRLFSCPPCTLPLLFALKLAKVGHNENCWENIVVTCRLPEEAEEWRLFGVIPLGWEPVPEDDYTVEAAAGHKRMVWTIPDLDVAEWFVISDGPY